MCLTGSGKQSSSFGHPPLTHSANKHLLCAICIVLDPEIVTLMDGRVSAFVICGRHMHKFISTCCQDGTMIKRISGSRYAFLSKVAMVVVLYVEVWEMTLSGLCFGHPGFLWYMVNAAHVVGLL